MSAKIAAALHQVMSAVGYVQKTGRNEFHKYRYAGEADLLARLRPAMVDAGLMLIPSVDNVSAIDDHGNVTVMVSYTLVHKEGEVWPEKLTAVGCGNDRSNKGTVGDKGVYKAITGANKYLLFKLFQIETGDDPEDDSKGGDPHAKTEPVRKLKTPRQTDAETQVKTRIINYIATATDYQAMKNWWRDVQPEAREVLDADDYQRIVDNEVMPKFRELKPVEKEAA